jgi:hypothetical protein
MRKRTIDKLLQAAIVEQAAEQGELWDREPVLEPIPEESQKRFDAALYGEPPKQTGAEDFFGQPAPKPAPEPKRRRVLAFALTGVSLAAVVLVVGLMIGVSRGEKGIKPDVLAPVNPDAQSTNAPPAGAGVRPADAPAPGLAEPTDTPTPGEPLPYTSATFADENAAVDAMMRFYEENRELLMKVAVDMKLPECGHLEGGVLYPRDNDTNRVLYDRPSSERTEAIDAFLALPDSDSYVLEWDTQSYSAPVFLVSLRWFNDEGYYSTDLWYSESGDFMMQLMYERKGSFLEPIYEDCGWGITTTKWSDAPYWISHKRDLQETTPEAAEPLRAEDLIGTWNKWQADNVDFSDQFTLREDGTATRTQRLYSEQEYEGTYSVRDDAALLTFGAVTQQAVCDPKADVMLLFDSPLSWLSYYRDSRNDIKEHWFEIKWETLPNKTIAQEEFSGVWELKRAESAFASVDLSGLSGFLTFVQGKLPQMRVQMQLAGRGVSVTRYYELDDSVLYVENEDEWGNILMANEAILDPDTNELKLCYVWTKRPLTRADSVLVFEKLPEAEEVLTREGLVGTWKLYGGMLYSAGGQMTLFFREDGTVQIRSKKDGIFTTSDMDSYSIVDNTVHFYKDGEEYRPFGDDELWFGTGMLIVGKPSDSLWSASFYRCSPQSF